MLLNLNPHPPCLPYFFRTSSVLLSRGADRTILGSDPLWPILATLDSLIIIEETFLPALSNDPLTIYMPSVELRERSLFTSFDSGESGEALP